MNSCCESSSPFLLSTAAARGPHRPPFSCARSLSRRRRSAQRMPRATGSTSSARPRPRLSRAAPARGLAFARRAHAGAGRRLPRVRPDLRFAPPDTHLAARAAVPRAAAPRRRAKPPPAVPAVSSSCRCVRRPHRPRWRAPRKRARAAAGVGRGGKASTGRVGRARHAGAVLHDQVLRGQRRRTRARVSSLETSFCDTRAVPVA